MTAGAARESLRTATVAVLSGGASDEREISLATGRCVVAALAEDGPPARVQDVRIEADGAWRVDGARLCATAGLERLGHVDVFFLGLHGAPGEDGTLQGLLESCGRTYTGSGVRASALCMDKLALRLLAAEAGARVAPGVCASRRAWASSAAAIEDRVLSLPRLPGDRREARWVVKPRCGGSSVGTRVVGEQRDLSGAIEGALAVDGHVLVEAFIPGVEVSCGVLGNASEQLRALSPIEIRPADGRFFDYQQKYDADGATELCPAPSLDAGADRRVRELAELAHAAGGCDGYSRVDFIVPASGDPVLLEVNTLPGLTERSLLPQEAAAEGIGYRDLCLFILDRAHGRRSPA